jgi:hypothetical protein
MATSDDPPPPESERDRERDPRDDRDGLPETLRQRLESLVPELVKKTFAAGMGAVFSTEEGIRKLARENLSNLNITEEVAKILTTLSFEIKTEIRFIPNSERFGGAEPDVKASVRLKRNDVADKDKEKDKDKDKDHKDAGKDAAADDGRDSRSRLRFWRRDGQNGGDEGDEGESPDK